MLYAGELAAFSSGHSFLTPFKKFLAIYIKTLDHRTRKEKPGVEKSK